MVSGERESGGLSRRGPRTQRRDWADLLGTQVNLTELQVNIIWLQVNSAVVHCYQGRVVSALDVFVPRVI